jgi:bifunctional aspartokinase / homoserine dehydrogenase 1
MMHTITLKFGGSTLNTVDNIHRVCQIIASKSVNNNCYVVVSALKGSTERLIDICKTAKSSLAIADEKLLSLVTEHQQLANTILNTAHARAWSQEVAIYIEAAQKRLQNPTQTDADTASILALGEKLSAALISNNLKQSGKNCNWICSESLIKTTGPILHALLDDKATQQCFFALNKDYPRLKITLITGFSASNKNGQTTLLGRNASDYSAAIVAKYTGSESVELFGDTAGILSADPDYVPGANTIAKLSFSDALQLAQSGSGVLHPRTIEPLLGTAIALYLSDLGHGGSTYITEHIEYRAQSFIATWSPVENRTLSKTPDLPKHLQRWQNNAPQASIISVFLANHLDAKACQNTLLQLAEKADIAVLQVNHFAKYKSLAFSIKRQDLERFTRIAHSAIQPLHQETAVAIIGASGNVGRKTLQLLLSEAKNLHAENGTLLRIVAICNSTRILWCKRNEGDVENLLQRLNEQPAQAHSAQRLLKELSSQCFDKLVVVDASASPDIAALYEHFLAQGIAIVTPNKLANSAGFERFENLKQLANKQSTPYLYETTVAAALPIIRPLLDLRRAGDKPIRIEAVLSGTIAYVLDRIQDNIPFTQAIDEAVAKGFAEPDPLQDLSGEDVARKILILLRTCGVDIERAQIQLTPLQSGNAEGLLPHDTNLHWQEKVFSTKQTGKRLCYVASFIDAQVTVALQEVDALSPFFRLRGTENAVVYQSDIYHDTPLTISGPGAGIHVTSAGVFTDVVAAAESLSRRAGISALAA